MSNSDLKIITDIKNQLLYSTSKSVLFSWGINTLMPASHNNMPALSFLVDGFIFSGKVLIAYSYASDTYIVYLIDKNENEVKHVENVYCDMMSSTIDELVERSSSCTDTEYYNKVVNSIFL